MSSKKKTAKTPAEKMQLVKAEGHTASLATGNHMAGMFTDTVSEDMEVKSRWPWLKPTEFPVGPVLTGIIHRVKTVESNKPKGKSWCLVEIAPLSGKIGVAITAVATIASALEITEEGGEFITPYLGHKVSIQKLADKIPSKKGQDAWNFIVAVSPDPVKVS